MTMLAMGWGTGIPERDPDVLSGVFSTVVAGYSTYNYIGCPTCQYLGPLFLLCGISVHEAQECALINKAFGSFTTHSGWRNIFPGVDFMALEFI